MFALKRTFVIGYCRDEFLRSGVHEFECGEYFGELAFGFAVGGLDGFEGGEAEESYVYGFGALGSEDGYAGDDADGAFSADEELFEVVAGVVFAEAREVVNYGAVGEDGFDAQDAAVEAAVP
jgi:hypothetical protein